MSARLTDAERARRYRARRRHGAVLVTVAVSSRQLMALECLGLLAEGERNRTEIADAVARSLALAEPLRGVIAALYPAASG